MSAAKHRKPEAADRTSGDSRNIARRTMSVAAALAVLALGMTIREKLPAAQEQMDRPFTYAADAPSFGELGDLEVQAGTQINGVTTHGLWVVVSAPFTPHTHDLLATATLTAADGRIFEAYNNFRQPCGVVYPNLPTTCAFAFEMPADAVAGATFTLSPGQNQMAAHIVRELGIDKPRAEQLSGATGPLDIPEVRA